MLITDFDGVHTDDAAYVDQNGRESVRVSRSDGLGIERLRQAGVAMLIVSKETNPVVRARAAKLGVEVLNGVEHKAEVVRDWLAARGNPGRPGRLPRQRSQRPRSDGAGGLAGRRGRRPARRPECRPAGVVPSRRARRSARTMRVDLAAPRQQQPPQRTKRSPPARSRQQEPETRRRTRVGREPVGPGTAVRRLSAGPASRRAGRASRCRWRHGSSCASSQARSGVLIMPRRRSSSVPRHPEPSKTVLIMSAETPKSEMIKVGSPAAMASSAAVEDTVTSARALSRASSIEPLSRPTARGRDPSLRRPGR